MSAVSFDCVTGISCAVGVIAPFFVMKLSKTLNTVLQKRIVIISLFYTFDSVPATPSASQAICCHQTQNERFYFNLLDFFCCCHTVSFIKPNLYLNAFFNVSSVRITTLKLLNASCTLILKLCKFM